MLNLEAAILTVFATGWNHFSTVVAAFLELGADGKSSILELETHISAVIGDFWS